jgi:hypothetical protein
MTGDCRATPATVAVRPFRACIVFRLKADPGEPGITEGIYGWLRTKN